MYRLVILSILMFFYLIPVVAKENRPLVAKRLNNEKSSCSMACSDFFEKSSDIAFCLKHCQEETRTRGGFTLEQPNKKKNKRPLAQGLSSTKM